MGGDITSEAEAVNPFREIPKVLNLKYLKCRYFVLTGKKYYFIKKNPLLNMSSGQPNLFFEIISFVGNEKH